MELLAFIGPAIPIASVPVALAIYILLLIWKIARLGPYLCIALVGGITYVVLSAVFPSDDVYLNELNYLTGIEFPREKAAVVTGDSSFPDMQGDYYVRANYLVTGFDFVAAARSARISEQTSCDREEVSKALRKEVTTANEAVCWSSGARREKNYYLVFYPIDGRLELTHMP